MREDIADYARNLLADTGITIDQVPHMSPADPRAAARALRDGWQAADTPPPNLPDHEEESRP
jgi:hypothetical protein